MLINDGEGGSGWSSNEKSPRKKGEVCKNLHKENCKIILTMNLRYIVICIFFWIFYKV